MITVKPGAIKGSDICRDGWAIMFHEYRDMNKDVPLQELLDYAGFENAIWCIRATEADLFQIWMDYLKFCVDNLVSLKSPDTRERNLLIELAFEVMTIKELSDTIWKIICFSQNHREFREVLRQEFIRIIN
jgi:hypothetical protein